MSVLQFDTNVLLNYIHAKTEERQFRQNLERCQQDEKLQDLRHEYEKYQDWLMKQDKEVKLLAAYARAYSDLFGLEMKRLYQEAWGKSADDPRQAPEVKEASLLLSDGTRELVKRAAQGFDGVRKRQNDLVQQIIDSDLVMSNAFLNAGWTYYVSDQWDLAIEAYERAIAANPTNAAAHNNLGNAYTRKRDFQRAEEKYREALKLNTEHPIFNHNMGRMLSRQEERRKDALVYYENAIGFLKANDFGNDPYEASIQNDKALTFASLHLWDDAIEAYGRALALQPFDSVLYANLAHTYEQKYQELAAKKQADTDATVFAFEAAVSYKMAAALDTSGSAAAYQRNLAEIYRSQSNWSDALGAAQEAVTSSRDTGEKAESLYQLGQIYEQKGDLYLATDAYLQVLSISGTRNSRRTAVLVTKLRQSGKAIPAKAIEEAIRTCREAIEREPAGPEHRADLASVYDNRGDYTASLEEHDAAVQLATAGNVSDEEMAHYYNGLGLAYRRMEVVELAVSYYQRAIQLHASPVFYKNLGLLLQAKSRFDQAREPLEKARDGSKSDDYDILLALSAVYAKGSEPDFDRAQKFCAKAAELRPGDPTPYAALAEPLLREQLFADAASAYRMAAGLASQPDERGEYLRSASGAYEKAITTDPGNLELHFWHGDMLFRLEDFNQAESAYRKALDLSTVRGPDPISIHEALGTLFDRRHPKPNDEAAKEDYEAAIKQWETALQISEDLTREERETLSKARLGKIDLDKIKNNLGTAYDALDDKEAAQARYEEVVNEQPGTVVARINLGNSRYGFGDYREALGQFQEAFRLKHPDALSPLILFRIGNCYFRLKRGDLARPKWEEAVKYQPNFVQALYNLGVLSAWESGTEEAVQRWQAALQVAPDLADAQYNLAILGLRRGDVTEAKKLDGQPGFESLVPLIAAAERGEASSDAALRDIKDR
jgi:tetratricopeptide (TPR) repeat protein